MTVKSCTENLKYGIKTSICFFFIFHERAGVFFISWCSVIHPLRGLLTWSLSKLDASFRSDEILFIDFYILVLLWIQHKGGGSGGGREHFPETCDSGTIASSFNEKHHIGDYEHSSSQYSSAFCQELKVHLVHLDSKSNSSENISSYDFVYHHKWRQ